MASVPSVADAIKSAPQFETALNLCVDTLRRIAGYEIDPSMNRRMRELGERKEFLDECEHDELMMLVGFSEQRTSEKLEAQLALKRLGESVPELVNES